MSYADQLAKHSVKNAAAIIPVEVAVIGSVLMEGGKHLPQGLRVVDFFKEGHRTIWAAILDLVIDDGAVDLVTLSSRLRLDGTIDDVGGVAYLAQCLDEGVLSTNVLAYARIIREAAVAREMQKLGAELIAGGMSPSQVAARLDEMPGPMTTAIYDPAVNWHRIVTRWGEPQVLTGLPWLDKITNGLATGTMIAIAGRTSHGKTAFAVNLSRVMATAGHRIDYITLEETDDSITRRLIANLTGIHGYKLLIGKLAPSDFQQAEAAVSEIQGLPITVTAIDTIRSLDEDTVVGVVSQAQGKVIVIDHLQKISTRGESRQYGLERTLNRLHAIAIKHNKIVIVLVQLGRDMEKEQREPRLSDSRDSGAIEMAARQVWLLYWPWKQKQDESSKTEYKINVAKHSEGATGYVNLAFDYKCGRFATPEGEAAPPDDDAPVYVPGDVE